MKVTTVKLPIEADPSQVIKVIDVIVKHLSALRDDLADLLDGEPPCRDPSCGLVFAHPASQHPKLVMPAAVAVCCDMHNRNCEPPSELCCGRCTEARHCAWTSERGVQRFGHPPGEACASPDLSQAAT